jgi:lysophospholipase L1-like esterase
MDISGEHIVLLGDSVFDNKSYVGSTPDVITHLKEMSPPGWDATLCAIDGDTTSGIKKQIRRVPNNASCLFLSVGGNDALMNVNLLYNQESIGIYLLSELAVIADAFRSNYLAAVNLLTAVRKPIYLFTIYNGNLEPDIATAAKSAVAVFNDKIYSVANELHLPVIELRRICNQPEDYANPIEPSGIGGKKIAQAILDAIYRRQKYLKMRKGGL